jgi:hypothetical protein
MNIPKFKLESNITKTLISGTKLYEVYVENGEIKMMLPNSSVTIGFTADYVESAIQLINNPDVADTRIQNDWYGDGKAVKFYGRDSRGISNLLGWINYQFKFMFKQTQSPLSPTEKK